jgi:rhodopsin domain-containing protein
MLASEGFYIVTIVFLKLSLGVFFLRIVIQPWQTRVVQFTVGLAAVIGIAYFFYAIFQCGAPIVGPSFWMKTIAKECVSDKSILGVSYTHAILTTSTDFVLALLPIFILRHARNPFREKLIIYCILLVGTTYVIQSFYI